MRNKETKIQVDDVARDSPEIVEIDSMLSMPEEDRGEYIQIKMSEYKELLIVRGKYEELKTKENPTIQYVPYTPTIQPLRYPDVIYSSPKVTFASAK